mgnify:CR=1 FL=1
MKEELIEMLKEKSYRKGDYTLSSGVKSEHYVNCKPVTLSGKGLALCSLLMLDYVEKDAAAVGGLTLGADPLVSGVAMAACSYSRDLSALIVRKEPKGHGTASQIEGPLPPTGSKITVLEDVVTTGGSSIKAVNVLRDVGYVVDRVVTIVDRQEGAKELMKAQGIQLESLVTLEDLM